jgi:hypothetical protein
MQRLPTLKVIETSQSGEKHIEKFKYVNEPFDSSPGFTFISRSLKAVFFLTDISKYLNVSLLTC